MYHFRFFSSKAVFNFLKYPIIVTVCFVLASCTGNILPGFNNSPQCQSNCGVGSGVQGVQVFVEPDDGEQVITNAIESAQKSIWLEIYILSDRNVIRALEDAANRGLDVRVMLEPNPIGGGTSPSKTLDTLAASGVKTQFTNPSFSLTHEKGMIIDGSSALYHDIELFSVSTWWKQRQQRVPQSRIWSYRYNPTRCAGDTRDFYGRLESYKRTIQ